jgi:hypothetical protein
VSKIASKNNNESLGLKVKDTDFLLKLLMRSNFEGNEVEQAYLTIQKLGMMHRRNLES